MADEHGMRTMSAIWGCALAQILAIGCGGGGGAAGGAGGKTGSGAVALPRLYPPVRAATPDALVADPRYAPSAEAPLVARRAALVADGSGLLAAPVSLAS